MKVVIVEPQKRPYVKEIEHTLRELQRIAGDTIQVVYPFHDRVGIICDDEGKLNGKPLNRCLYDDNGKPYDQINRDFMPFLDRKYKQCIVLMRIKYDIRFNSFVKQP